jgi:uncharacterized protein YcaQ
MDYMWNSGELGVKEKKNTQKKYDLIERLLPSEILYESEPFQNDEDFYKCMLKEE